MKKEKEEKYCKACGRLFIPSKALHSFCSERCQKMTPFQRQKFRKVDKNSAQYNFDKLTQLLEAEGLTYKEFQMQETLGRMRVVGNKLIRL